MKLKSIKYALACFAVSLVGLQTPAVATFDTGSMGGFTCRAYNNVQQQDVSYGRARIINNSDSNRWLQCWIIGDHNQRTQTGGTSDNNYLYLYTSVPGNSTMACYSRLINSNTGGTYDSDSETYTNAGASAVLRTYTLNTRATVAGYGGTWANYFYCFTPPGGVIYSSYLYQDTL